MWLLSIVLLFCHLYRSSVVADPVKVQIQQWGEVGSQQIEEQVLLNGVSFTSQNKEFNKVVKMISADTLLPVLTNVNKTPALRTHTVLRSRECTLEGSMLQWSDLIFIDGWLCLTLEQNDTWTGHVPQALTVKVVLDQEVQRTRAERVHLQEGCVELMKDLKLSGEQPGPDIPCLQFLIPILAVIMFGLLIIVSTVIYKRKGLRHPGGVIGSIVHYHRDIAGMDRRIV